MFIRYKDVIVNTDHIKVIYREDSRIFIKYSDHDYGLMIYASENHDQKIAEKEACDEFDEWVRILNVSGYFMKEMN